MADISGASIKSGGSPSVTYTITYNKIRPSNSQMTYNFSISCALGSPGSYIYSGYALLCTITVNGSSNQVRIKANDNDNWEGDTPRVKKVSVTCSSTTGHTNQPVRFQVVSDGRLPMTSGVVDNSSYTVLSSLLLTTACGAPSACAVSSTVSEGNVTLSWSGAASGTNNTISSYEIQYSESNNNSSWGNWMDLITVNTTATSGSVSVAPSATRGNYRQFRVRTQGSAGTNYYSGWKISTNSVRRNTVPSAPSTVTASPANYSSEPVTVTWSGASGGTSAIKGYQIASRTSTNNRSWSAWSVLTTMNLAASGGSYTAYPVNTPGTYTQFGVWTIDVLGVYSDEKISNSVYCNITACGAPTSCSLSATLSEGALLLSWSGASHGAGNSIVAYQVQFSESPDNNTWGAWSTLPDLIQTSATSGSTTVHPPVQRGYYRRFQIQAQGTAGSAYYSPWKISSNTVQKNILPTPPTVFEAVPSVYIGDRVVLNWSGVIPGTSTIRQYQIQQSTSTDGVTWSAWESILLVDSSETSGSKDVIASAIPGMMTKYHIRVMDSLSGVTDFVESNMVQKNRPPIAPIVEAPKSDGITYNQNPMLLIETQAEPDGLPQTIYVYTAAGYWQNSVDNPDSFSTSGASPDSVKTIFTNPTVSPGKVSVEVQCRDAYAIGATVSRSFTIELSPFEEIVPSETHVKADHILTLRTAVNNIRNYYNLSAYTWQSDVISGKTQVRDWPNHILELRAGLQGVIDKINSFDSAGLEFDIPDFDWLPIGTGRPRADVMNQLRDVILQL